VLDVGNRCVKRQLDGGAVQLVVRLEVDRDLDVDPLSPATVSQPR